LLVVGREDTVRTIKTAEELGALLRLQASLLVECRDCLIGDVIWHAPDDGGCNWRVSRLEGSGAGGCLLALQTLLVSLREAYNLNPMG
jgi:hypothetical protein